jgi:hypothetical protein
MTNAAFSSRTPQRIRRWINRNVDHPMLAVWKLFFCGAAVLDMWSCRELIWAAFYGYSCKDCSKTNLTDSRIFIGALFCGLCVVESIVRATEARRLALENHALDTFERRLQRVYSTTRVSFGIQRNSENLDQEFAKTTLRTYIPMCSVIVFWIVLLPTRAHFYTCGNDTAIATVWITNFLQHLHVFVKFFQDCTAKYFWKKALPFKLYQPRRFLGRVRTLLRCIRYIRFAFPLFRILLKLHDQFQALVKMRRQNLAATQTRKLRSTRRSFLLEDLRRVESLAKVQTALAALPSRLFQYAQEQNELFSETLLRQQRHGRRLQQQFQRIQRDLRSSFSDVTMTTADQYDRIVQITQEVKHALHNTVLSSHNLLSPRTRFSIIWRITVTNVLVIEMVRLMISWKISGTFKVSLSQIITRILIECDYPETQRKHLSLFTDQIDRIRKKLSDAFPLLPPPETLVVCLPASTSATLFLAFGNLVDNFIDIVSFLDIFIWFYTGDLDSSGVVVPKPFFTRCIVPGTLVQVMDHPTLPELLPSIFSSTMDATSAVGWSRAVRWMLAIGPALIMVFEPLKSYFFGHVASMKGIMRLAESCGVLAPSRPYSSTMSKSSNSVHPLKRQSENLTDLRDSIRSNMSQVGLSFDHPSTTVLAGRSIVTPIHEDFLAPSSDESATLRRRAIHFDDEFDIGSNTRNSSYSFSYSSQNLQTYDE